MDCPIPSVCGVGAVDESVSRWAASIDGAIACEQFPISRALLLLFRCDFNRWYIRLSSVLYIHLICALSLVDVVVCLFTKYIYIFYAYLCGYQQPECVCYPFIHWAIWRRRPRPNKDATTYHFETHCVHSYRRLPEKYSTKQEGVLCKHLVCCVD